jgi:hypothetical protein
VSGATGENAGNDAVFIVNCNCAVPGTVVGNAIGLSGIYATGLYVMLVSTLGPKAGKPAN